MTLTVFLRTRCRWREIDRDAMGTVVCFSQCIAPGLSNLATKKKKKQVLSLRFFFSSTGKAMKPEFMIVKTWEESETWPYLQVNQLGCHSFMDAGNRHKTPGPEVKRCLEESRTASSRSFLVSVVPFFSRPMEVTKSGPGGCCTPSGFV